MSSDKNGPNVSSRISLTPKCHSWAIASNCLFLCTMHGPSSRFGSTCPSSLLIIHSLLGSLVKVPVFLCSVFQLPLLPSLSQKISVSIEIFKIIIIAINFSLIFLYAIHFRSNFMNNSLTKALKFLIFFSMTAIVPTTHLTIISI